MRAAQEIIAKKYAQALLNLYFDVIKPECFDTLIVLNEFFKKNERFIRYLCIPTIPDSIKEKMLEKVFESLMVCSTVKQLVAPLMKQRRIELLKQVISQLIDRYRLKIGSVKFSVSTSHQLSSPDQEKIVTFLSKETNKIVLADFFVDKKLICGFRAESKTFLFERSVVKKIRDVKTSFYQRIKS